MKSCEIFELKSETKFFFVILVFLPFLQHDELFYRAPDAILFLSDFSKKITNASGRRLRSAGATRTGSGDAVH